MARILSEVLVYVWKRTSCSYHGVSREERSDLGRDCRLRYENVFLHYTMKQWERFRPDWQVYHTGRVPPLSAMTIVTQVHRNRACQRGYTKLFWKHAWPDLIDVFGCWCSDIMKLSALTSAFARNHLYEVHSPVLWWFQPDQGALPYRTLDIVWDADQDQFQPVGTVNYTTSEDLASYHWVLRIWLVRFFR